VDYFGPGFSLLLSLTLTMFGFGRLGFSPLGGCADALAIKAAVRRAKIAHRFIFQSCMSLAMISGCVGYARRSVPRMFVRGFWDAIWRRCILKRMQSSASGCDPDS
jgi:hypothetical protein